MVKGVARDNEEGGGGVDGNVQGYVDNHACIL